MNAALDVLCRPTSANVVFIQPGPVTAFTMAASLHNSAIQIPHVGRVGYVDDQATSVAARRSWLRVIGST